VILSSKYKIYILLMFAATVFKKNAHINELCLKYSIYCIDLYKRNIHTMLDLLSIELVIVFIYIIVLVHGKDKIFNNRIKQAVHVWNK